jgi:hypothetical protein
VYQHVSFQFVIENTLDIANILTTSIHHYFNVLLWYRLRHWESGTNVLRETNALDEKFIDNVLPQSHFELMQFTKSFGNQGAKEKCMFAN